MTTATKFSGWAIETGRAAMVAALCVLMAAPEAFAASPADGDGGSLPAAVQRSPLTQNQRVLQALNRFTFGPRPGDEAVVEKMGLKKWFEMQLHPDTIDDSAFATRMEQFPALQLSDAELMQRFPAPGMIKRMAQRDQALPQNPAEHAIYADSMAAYRARLGPNGAALGPVGAAAPKGEAASSGNSMDSDASMQDGAMQYASMQNGAMQNGAMQADGTPGDTAMKGNVPAEQSSEKDHRKHHVTAERMSQADVHSVLALPPEQRMTKLLAMSPEELAGFRRGVGERRTGELMAGLTPQQRETLEALRSPLRTVATEAMEARIERDVFSQRQLQAVMDDFWLNHFSIYLKKNEREPYYLASFEREAILPNSLGKFEDLLVATAKSPAMLMFLDNWESIGPDSPTAKRIDEARKNHPGAKQLQKLPEGINENYGRELMELHTLGVNGGYTQKDVIAVARCLTGWTIDRPYGGRSTRPSRYGTSGDVNATPGGFVFDASRHEPGPEVVMGHTIPAGGISQGLEVLHLLATSPATAHYISTKLAERFVSDTPPNALVDRMAATFLKTDGDIKAVLTTMFDSPEFWSPKVYRAKVKTPIEFLASALRASDATVTNPTPLVQVMSQLGMPIFGAPEPNGYSWDADHWVSSNALISRMNFALVLSGDRVPGTKTNWLQLLGDGASPSVAAAPSAQTERRLEEILLGQPATTLTRSTVLQQFKNPTAQQEAQKSLELKPGTQQSDENSMDSGPMLLRTGYTKGGHRAGGFQNNRPETPLDTMAGLLLGSPDFQRR